MRQLLLRVVDYIAQELKNRGVDTVFMVPGGGCIYLVDGFHCAGMRLISCHHEQAAAMAAEGYAKVSGRLGVCLVTTGCGGTNAITGTLNAWQDSTPVLFLSGQSFYSETIDAAGIPLRQLGVQEANIVPIVQSITKYAAMVKEPNQIASMLGIALAIAFRNRHGPVWLDIPLDVQGAEVDVNALKVYEDHYQLPEDDPAKVKQAMDLLRAAKRPVVIVGQGVRLAGACDCLREFVDRYNLPVVATWLGIDVLPSDRLAGRLGREGDTANALVREADFVLAIGSRLSLASTLYKPKEFAPKAKVVVVDIDKQEHLKPGVSIDLFIHADAREFLEVALTGCDAAEVRRCW